MINETKYGVATIFAGVLTALAQQDWSLYVLFLIVTLIDIITGALYHLRNGTFNSSVLGKKTLDKVIKGFIVFGFYVLNVTTIHMGININYAPLFVGIMIFTDFISMVENIGGVPKIITEFIKKLLKMLEGGLSEKDSN